MGKEGRAPVEDWDWRILQVLHEQKNITKTAQALFMSQPALTSRLQHIEKEFGIKIVVRTSKGVQFTPQGEYLARSSEEVLQKIRGIREQVSNLDKDVVGTLRIGASSYFTMYTLPALLRSFHKEYPAVDFKVTTAWSKEIFNQVQTRQIHLGFISSDYGWEGRKHLLMEESIYVASAEPIALAKLPSLPRIDYQSDALIKGMIDRWWRERFGQPPLISMEVDKLATCKEMVRYGLGYAILPGRIIHDTDNLYKIMLCDKQGNPLIRKSWLIYYADSLEMNVVRAFVEFVEAMDLTQVK